MKPRAKHLLERPNHERRSKNSKSSIFASLICLCGAIILSVSPGCNPKYYSIRYLRFVFNYSEEVQVRFSFTALNISCSQPFPTRAGAFGLQTRKTGQLITELILVEKPDFLGGKLESNF
ncbi:Uncharacterized protein Adt_11219 [Abeliophyllum distichum]|uniref:Uncharacterized protein n=1 Tax=Abeliophyllum distichum TaxID=126358 RepID=A0ABD1UMG1_9LAMI